MPFLGLCLLTATYVFANFQLFVNYLSPGEPSHRSAFASAGFSLLSILNELSILLISQYHAGTCLAALIVVLFIIEWRKYRREDKFLDYIFTVYLSITGLFLLGVAIKEGLSFISFIREFQVDRFFFLFPAMFFTMFGAVVYEYVRHARRKALIWSCVALVLVNFAFDPHSRDNIARKLEIANCPGFNQFYDTKLFDRIKTDLKIKEFDDKVICLGMYQAVAEYNDIYTVDGYIQMYPLRYKLQFQKVIQGELDKSEDIREYFCDWGERCYLFSAELGRNYLFGKKEDRHVKQLDIDCKALSELGCKYILSAVAIDNYESLGLEYLGSWTNPDSWWNVRAYALPLNP